MYGAVISEPFALRISSSSNCCGLIWFCIS